MIFFQALSHTVLDVFVWVGGCFGSCGEREREEANGRVRVYALLVDSLPCIVLRCIAL